MGDFAEFSFGIEVAFCRYGICKILNENFRTKTQNNAGNDKV